MTECTAVIKSPTGLHARPASAFVQECLRHQCAITVEYLGKKADGKSILQVLALGVKHGQEITIRAEGVGEHEAVNNLTDLVDKL